MADFTLVIGNKNYSSWSLRAWLWVKHLQLDFDEILIQLYQQGMEENLSAYFSGGKVPLLIHGDLQVWDSLAILEYLASLHPEKSGTADIPARAVMRSLCAEMHSSFTSLRQELPMNCRRAPHALDISPNCRDGCMLAAIPIRKISGCSAASVWPMRCMHPWCYAWTATR